MTKVFYHHLDLYKFLFIVGITSEDFFDGIFHKLHVEPIDTSDIASAVTVLVNIPEGEYNRKAIVCAFCISDVMKNPLTPGIVAHEAFHAAAAIFDDVGELVVKKDFQEPWAYLIGYLVELIYKDIGKYVKTCKDIR